jgi:NAD-dependent deacetylase
MDKQLEKVRNKLREARRVAVITGAGVSAESGVPTFRGKEGLWRNHDPMQLATPEAFHRDPKLVWQWYNWRRELIAKCQPNPGHKALVELEKRIPEFLLITQNVDGLHELAGSEKIVRIHGSIWQVRYADTAAGTEWEDRNVPVPRLPYTDEEGRMLRPGVVWFGEMLPRNEIMKIEQFFSESDPDLILIAGTSALFPYIQSWAMSAGRHGGLLVEVNRDPTPLSQIADISIEGKSGEILPRLVG